MIRHHSLLAALLAAAGLPAALAAQAVVQPLGQTDADLLAAQMRLLAADPRNMAALATAGELSLRLGDLSGAAALFARADKIDPRSGRVKAGMGSILVRSERPGEALRFFQQAESYGWPVARYAADRGLAFDLVGQQDRAQRDYRLALASGADDETARRYALSLGIAGKQAQALEQLDPLVRRQDRAAWRARAFVMAMNGDTAGAAKIATTMMPAGMAQGLGAFFQRLPTLPAVDRAFAVHFGEIYATPARLADARLTPTYAPLPPEPVAQPPVQVAAAVAPATDRRSRRDRERAERAARDAATRSAARASQPIAVAATTPPPAARTSQPVAVAATTPPVASTATAMRESNVRVGAVQTQQPASPATLRPAPAIAAARTATSPGVPVRVATLPPYRPTATTPPSASPSPSPSSSPVQVAAATPVRPTPTTGTPATVPSSPPPTTVAPAPTTAPVVAQATTPVAPVASEAATERADSVLARIVASLSIPASELGVAPTRPEPGPVAIPTAVTRATPSAVGKRVVAEASAKEGRDAALRRTVAARLTGDPDADDPVKPGARGRRGATQLAAVDADAPRTARSRRGAALDPAADDAPTTGRAARRRRGATDAPTVTEAEEPATGRATRSRRGATDPAVAEAEATPAGRRARTRRGTAADDGELANADTAAPRTRGRRGSTAEADDAPLTPAQRRAADRKVAADKKAAAEKKELAEQAAAEKKAARANPARIWVQVAGGANESDLGKAWSAAQAKSPALKGRAGYKTPLRATNRVLTGPFKTDAEARAFVNQLGRQGVSAFSFTSDAGQKVEKLGTATSKK